MSNPIWKPSAISCKIHDAISLSLGCSTPTARHLALRQRQWSITPLSLQNSCLQLHACWLSPPTLCAHPDIMCCDHILTHIMVKPSYNNSPYRPAADTTAPSNAILLSLLSCGRAAPNLEPQKTLMELVVLWEGGTWKIGALVGSMVPAALNAHVPVPTVQEQASALIPQVACLI